METDEKVVRQQNISWTKMGERVVILDSRDGRVYHEMDEVGSFIWENLEAPIGLEKLVEQVTDEFDIDQVQASKDVQDFLESLKKQNLI
tara:strand:- start:44626 stop:44892 length:267 start_codon:yes stop_codon:yes gene_type:complete